MILAAIQHCLQNQYGFYWLSNKINGQAKHFFECVAGRANETMRKTFPNELSKKKMDFDITNEAHNVIYCDKSSLSCFSFHRLAAHTRNAEDFYQTEKEEKKFLHILHQTITFKLISCFVSSLVLLLGRRP